MKAGVLAVQGDFLEHEKVLEESGISILEIRQKCDAEQDFDFLILPGGESTVQRKLIEDLGFKQLLEEKIKAGLPVFATCAGLILLADYFKTLPVTVLRNAYGRQTGSFFTEAVCGPLTKIPMTFIRAPIISSVDNSEVEVLAVVEEKIVAVKYKNQLAMSFHPELNQDRQIYNYFLKTTGEW